MFLPGCPPKLNPIERPRGSAKWTADGKYRPDFASFRAATEATLVGIPTEHAGKLESRMTLPFPTFEDVSLPAAQGRDAGRV